MSAWLPEPPAEAAYTLPLGESCRACGYPLTAGLCERCAARQVSEGTCPSCIADLDRDLFCNLCGKCWAASGALARSGGGQG